MAQAKRNSNSDEVDPEGTSVLCSFTLDDIQKRFADVNKMCNSGSGVDQVR